MSQNLLSPVFIQKLGHPIEEIRTRALFSIISKYNLKLVDDCNFENGKLMFEKLLNWFTFENYSQEDKVFKLMLTILQQKNGEYIVKSLDCNEILKKLKSMETKISVNNLSLLEEVIQCVNKKMGGQSSYLQTQFKPNADCEVDVQIIHCNGDKSEGNQGDTSKNYESVLITNQRFINDGRGDELMNIPEQIDLKGLQYSISSQLKFNNRLSSYDTRKCKMEFKTPVKNTLYTKIEYFPWQNLVKSDSVFFSSIYEGLRYLDEVTSVKQACDFYMDILLRDFPPEIFLQRPLLMQTFLELFQSDIVTVRLPVIKCLIATVEVVKNRLKSVLDVSVAQRKSEFLNLKFKMYDDDGCPQYGVDSKINLDDNLDQEEEVSEVKSHQYSVSQFCFLVLNKTVPQLMQNKTNEEFNLMFKLISEISLLMSLNITSNVWNENNHFRENLLRMLSLFHEPLKCYKVTNRNIHLLVLQIFVKILTLLKPPEESLKEILPHCIQLELTECVADDVLMFLFPRIHSRILKYVQSFLGQRKKELVADYYACLEIFRSMDCTIEFLRNYGKIKSKVQKLDLFQRALPSLEFHKNFQFVQDFVRKCLMKWSGEQLSENVVSMRRDILLKLLSHGDDFIRVETYKEIHFHVTSLLGVDEAVAGKFRHPGNTFEFLFHEDVLTEIICHGLNADAEIQKLSTEVLLHILKGKFLFSEDYWKTFIQSLVPCLPLLQCYADKSTPLGRCIIKLFDPDVTKVLSLSSCDVIRGNLRFLYSRDHLIREEALSRLLWLLTNEDPEKRKLPRMSLLQGMNLSSLCSSVTCEEYGRINQSFYSLSSLNNVMEMLDAEGIEPSVRRSALSQISVMLEDPLLHTAFLEQNKLESVIRIFKNCLIEKEFQNYPDSVIPIMSILKHLCFHNPSVRLQLSKETELYHCILRGLLLFNSERTSRQHGVELLCLLLYNEHIINVREGSAGCKISLPFIVVSKICIPFVTRIHWRYSKHSEPSIRESLMLKEKTGTVLRLYWNIQWIGGTSRILTLTEDDLDKSLFSPSLPNDMKLKLDDLNTLQKGSIPFSVKKLVHEFQNATTHEAVIASLHSINGYLELYATDKELENDSSSDVNDLTSTLLNLPWESTFKRFLQSTPSCEEDEVLLQHVIHTVRCLLKTFYCKPILSWIVRLLGSEHQTLLNLLRQCDKQRTPAHRNLVRTVIGLIKDAIAKNADLTLEIWIRYVDLIVWKLGLNDRAESCDLVYTDWLVNLLVDMTGRFSPEKPELCKDVIIRVMEIIVALHCSKDSQKSYLGTNIIKNCLLILNHLLDDMKTSTKGWEELWYHSLTQITGHQEETNYCWLLSLWYVRDPVIRALSLQLLSGFSLTCRACELLMEQLFIEFEYVWNEGFNFLLDDDESNIVREKAALLLSNLTSHGSLTTAAEFLEKLSEIRFYEKLLTLIENLHLSPSLTADTSSFYLEHYSRFSTVDSFPRLSATTPSLITAICILLYNIIFLNDELVGDIIFGTGILASLMKILCDAPGVCEEFIEKPFISNILPMYSNACRLIAKCMMSSELAFTYIVQSQQFISSLFSLLNFNLYDKCSKTILFERNYLWRNILDVLTLSLIEKNESSMECPQNGGFTTLNNAITEIGTDYFISCLYMSLTSRESELRVRCLRFLNNLFASDGTRSSVSDLLERNIFSESVQLAESSSWKFLSIAKTLDLNFGKRISYVLLQTINQSDDSGSETIAYNTLGCLLAKSKAVQNFCSEHGLTEDITEKLKKLYVKLSLDNLDSLRKPSNKKKVDPILNQVEVLFRLLSNLFFGNEIIKAEAADLGLSNLVIKVWHWCLTRSNLLLTTLKMLCTFTLKSDSACRSLALSKSWSDVGQTKSRGSSTLLSLIMQNLEREIDLFSKSQSQNIEIVRLSFQLLENCCRVTECRCAISKGPVMASFRNFCSGNLIKKRGQSDDLVNMWFDFLVAFTSYQEGQLVVPKNQEVLDNLIIAANPREKSRYRSKALKILRNICFHQLNRTHLLSCYQFLTTIFQCLKSTDVEEEINAILYAIWGLIHNSQKGKLIVRNAGFEELLKQTEKKIKLSNSSNGLDVVNTVLQILQNK